MSKIQLSKNFIRSTCKLALNEDLFPSGDITSNLLKNNQIKKIKMVSNEKGIIGGLEFAKETFKLIDKKISFKIKKREGSKINRPKLVKLFSSILKREGNDYFLVTPMEKIGIKVDDAPFLVNSINTTGTGKRQNILFTTNIGETIIVSDDNLLRMEFNHKTNEPSPYVTVRRNLEGLIDRKTFYRLVDLGTIEHYDGDSWFGVWSKNTFFPITLQKNLVD